jgi:hypothetical protein
MGAEAVSLNNPQAGKIIEQRVKDITKVDVDRAQSILEAIQGVIITFIIGTITAHFIDKLFPVYSNDESDMDAVKFCFLQLSLNIVSAIYIGKLISIVPFFFNLTGRTTLGGNETSTALGFAMSIVFISTQSNFLKRVSRVKNIIVSYVS